MSFFLSGFRVLCVLAQRNFDQKYIIVSTKSYHCVFSQINLMGPSFLGAFAFSGLNRSMLSTRTHYIFPSTLELHPPQETQR